MTRLVLAAALLVAAGCAAAEPRPRGYECTMCKAHRDAPGVCCGAPARPCRYACTCGRHSDVRTKCCGREMAPCRAGKCAACGRAGIAGTPCCGGRMN